MTDALLKSTNLEEAISRAYVSAVVAGAGYISGKTEFDMEGIDLSVHAAGPFRPRIDVQLKATINLGEAVDGVFRYPLKSRNYDLLREETTVPRILVILDLPKSEKEWLTVSPQELIMRRCAYWHSLTGSPETTNKESVTISIQYARRFDVEGLKALMGQARSGVIS
jgi:Domain of unknown function (DUF4365)